MNSEELMVVFEDQGFDGDEEPYDVFARGYRLKSPLTWTKTLPTEEGTYWWRAKKDAIKRIVVISMNGRSLHALGYGAGDNRLNKWDGEFCGPIEEPEE